MGAKSALLWNLQLLIPGDTSKGTCFDYVSVSLALMRVNDHYPIFSLVHSTLLGGPKAGRVFTLHTKLGDIADLDFWKLSPLYFLDRYPRGSQVRLRLTIRQPGVIYKLVLASNKTIVAPYARIDIDNENFPFHILPFPSFHLYQTLSNLSRGIRRHESRGHEKVDGAASVKGTNFTRLHRIIHP
jgi:hypothetical protein